MKASIVSIGDELLAGQIIDTNAAYLSAKLLSVGIPTVSLYTVGDDIDSIVAALRRAAADAEVVLVTGGLGPTDDDLTRQGLAKFLGVELESRQELLCRIQYFFTKRNIEMPAGNKIQACIPAGCRALNNSLGTAPGIIAEYDGKKIVAMPGVPAEMRVMFEEFVLDGLQASASGEVVVLRKLKCFGAGESAIAEKLGDLMQRGRNPLINCTVASGVITLHIIARADNRQQAEKMLQADETLLRGILGQLVYGTGEETLAQVVGEKLAREKKTIAVAESCTGGLLAKLITDVPGASEYFMRGWVAYTNQAKIDELDVPADIIREYGAVSEQVAQAMAEAARRKAGTDFGIGITGIAGPGGESPQKPVGLVYIALSWLSGSESRRVTLSGDRNDVRVRASQIALNLLRLKLEV